MRTRHYKFAITILVGALGIVICASADESTNNFLPPVLLKRSKLELPARAMANRLTGEAVVEFVVTGRGGVEDRKIKATSYIPLLDLCALVAVKDWKFSPARSNGLPVAAHCEQTFTFGPFLEKDVGDWVTKALRQEGVFCPADPPGFQIPKEYKSRRPKQIKVGLQVNEEGRVVEIWLHEASELPEFDYLALASVYS